MTLFDYLQDMDLETFAYFLWGFGDQIYNDIMEQLEKQGYKFDKVSMPIVSINRYIEALNEDINNENN